MSHRDTTETTAAARRMKTYIEEHIREPITARQLADAAGYSPYHAARIFQRHTGRMPFDYIRECRLSSAALALRSGKPKVVDVALDFVFDSHEGFTRAFTRGFGIAPKRFATVPAPVGWRIPYYVSDRCKTHKEDATMSEKAAIVFTQIVERPARKLLLRRAKTAGDYVAYCEEFGCDETWDYLTGIKEALYEPVGLWMPPTLRPAETGEYAQGVELPADYRGNVPEGYDLIDLPACKMLIFQGEPYADEDYSEAIGALWDCVARFNPATYGLAYADEIAPRMQLAPQGWRGYIEMKPVREVAPR